MKCSSLSAGILVSRATASSAGPGPKVPRATAAMPTAVMVRLRSLGVSPAPERSRSVVSDPCRKSLAGVHAVSSASAFRLSTRLLRANTGFAGSRRSNRALPRDEPP